MALQVDVWDERLEQFARAALVNYGVGSDAELTLLNISENATYRVDDPATGKRTVLRIHRPGYHTQEAIESELVWLQTLRDSHVVRTPAVLPDLNGTHVVVARHADGEQRHAVMFDWCPGIEPPEDRLVEDFKQLGEITARLHVQSRAWVRPSNFTRFTWNFDTSLGPDGHWGSWRDGIAVGAAEAEVLGRATDLMGRRLADFGSGPDRFGLIHADLRLANLLLDGDDIYVIDFDDCGFGWYLYDLGSAVSFIEHYPQIPEMVSSWADGYRRVAPLSAADEHELPTFIMFRRLLLVAWIGSHSGTELAKSMGEEYTATSCLLAERYLSDFT
jgi:Ser/Thr protein kinase RdoA (MazF antagonist)